MVEILRRSLFKGFLAAGSWPGTHAAAAQGIIDVHVYVSRWPTRRMRGDETAELVEILAQGGVAEAWAGSFEALLFKDITAVNARLAEECERQGRGRLIPFGAINPKLPAWEEELRRCQERYRMPGIRLHPNYHHYTLRDPDFVRLLEAASERGLIVQIAAWMEDERCQNPLMRVPAVDLAPLPALLERLPKARVMVLNGFISVQRAPALESLARFDRVAFDFAMLDGMTELANLIGAAGIERVVFGSYSPMFYLESALLKVEEAALGGEEQERVFRANARRWLPRV
jgi:predicted TIM-barrel fold metal-dependent hydrolase